jgi:hypothetical protein
MSAHGRPEALMPKRAARSNKLSAHGRPEALMPKRAALEVDQ